MNTIFVIWRNFDGGKVEEYPNREQAEDACTSILAKEDAEEYGTCLDCVIEGHKLKPITIQIASKVKLHDDKNSH